MLSLSYFALPNSRRSDVPAFVEGMDKRRMSGDLCVLTLSAISGFSSSKRRATNERRPTGGENVARDSSHSKRSERAGPRVAESSGDLSGESWWSMKFTEISQIMSVNLGRRTNCPSRIPVHGLEKPRTKLGSGIRDSRRI